MTPLSALVLGFHLVKLAGLVSNLGAFPTLRREAGPATPMRTSILVPARDEAARLAGRLPGLLAQPADEVIVLDDESRDDTAQVVTGLSDPRLRLLIGTSPPPGWTGKNWACHQLAAVATGELLVFCDADVTLGEGALAAMWTQIRRQDADVFSVFPRQETATIGERSLVPLIDENLLAFLPHRLLDAPVPAAATANGQVLAFRRGAYEAVGGHRAVAGRIVEDVALARRSRQVGLKLGLALGGDLARARMYHGYWATVRGLGKSLRAAHGGSVLAMAVTAAWHLTAYTVPWLRLGRDRRWRWAAALGLLQRAIVNAKTGRDSYAEVALVPVTAIAAAPVYLVALRRTARWKGRTYR